MKDYTVVSQGKSEKGRDYLGMYILYFVLYIGLLMVFVKIALLSGFG